MRLVQLDVLRGIAVLLVLGRHLLWPTPQQAGSFVSAVVGVWATGGWIGVDLFFVLSGFLVSGLLFREYQQTGTVRPGRFLIRRGFKIYPAFYTLMIPVLIVVGPSAPQALGELLFLQNYAGNVLGYTWSLAVEEHFYLLLAAFAWCAVQLVPDRPFRALPLACVVLSVACLVARASLANEPYRHETHLVPTHLRIDSLAFGVLLSYGWHFGTLRTRSHAYRWWLCAAGIMLLVPAFIFTLGAEWWTPVFGFTVCYLGGGALLLGVVHLDLPHSLPVRWIARVGMYSYSIYLCHGVLNVVARLLLSHGYGWYAHAVVYLAGSILIGVLTAKAIEQPALAIRDRYFPARPREVRPGSITVQAANA